MATLAAYDDDDAYGEDVEDYSAEFDSVSSFASLAGSPRAAVAVAAAESAGYSEDFDSPRATAILKEYESADYSDSFASLAGSPRAAQAAAEDYSTDSFASLAGSPRAQAAAEDYSEDFESPRAAQAAEYSEDFDNASDDDADSLSSWQSLDKARAEARNVPKARQRELETLMVAAAMEGDRYLLLTHISEGARANASDADGRTALSLACAFDKSNAVTCLLQHGALCTRPDRDGRTPLWTACLKGSAACVASLAQDEALASTFEVSHQGVTCAYAAASSGNKDAVYALAGVDATCLQRRCDDLDVLACAAGRGDLKACEVLLEVARWAAPAQGATPLERALQAGAVECASILLAKVSFSVDLLKGDAKRPSLKRRCFEAAVRSQKSEALTWVLSSSEMASLPGSFGEHPTNLTPLMYCIVRAPPLVGVLLEHLNCDVSEPSGLQKTPPLLVAAVRGSAEACFRLLQRGADPNCADANGATAVAMAELTDARTAFPQLLALPDLPPDRWFAKEEPDVRIKPADGGRWRRRVDESYGYESFDSFHGGTPLPSPGGSYAQDSFHTPPSMSRSMYSATFEEEPLAIGMRIEAKYENGDEWYAGIIEGVQGGLYDVLYDDGDRETVDATLIRREIAFDASYSNAFESLRASDSTLPGTRRSNDSTLPGTRRSNDSRRSSDSSKGAPRSMGTQSEVLEVLPEKEVVCYPRAVAATAARQLSAKMEAMMKVIDTPPSDPLTYLRALSAKPGEPPAASPTGVEEYLQSLRYHTAAQAPGGPEDPFRLVAAPRDGTN
jgi:ankyrin repeat protein